LPTIQLSESGFSGLKPGRVGNVFLLPTIQLSESGFAGLKDFQDKNTYFGELS